MREEGEILSVKEEGMGGGSGGVPYNMRCRYECDYELGRGVQVMVQVGLDTGQNAHKGMA